MRCVPHALTWPARVRESGDMGGARPTVRSTPGPSQALPTGGRAGADMLTGELQGVWWLPASPVFFLMRRVGSRPGKPRRRAWPARTRLSPLASATSARAISRTE
jgi:hypothetical protein